VDGGELEVITFTVPLIPPGVNNYVRHTRSGRHYVTAEAKAFKEALILCARRAAIKGKFFSVEATVYLGKKQKGDVDGFAKLILDALAEAGVFMHHKKPQALSDAHVYDLHLRKRKDIENPRTEITVRAI